MNILTFDTAFDKTYITLSKDKALLAPSSDYTIASDKEKYHSAYLISNLAKILKENDLQMSDIDVIATNIGPGSFTGIRVCVTVARIISQQLNIKVYGIPSLEILARACPQSRVCFNAKNKMKKTGRCPALVVTDARKDKFYAAAYGKSGFNPTSMTLDEVLKIAKGDYFIISDSKTHSVLKENGIESFNYEGKNLPLGEYLMQIAYEKTDSYDKEPVWYNLKPLYIQPPPITIKGC